MYAAPSHVSCCRLWRPQKAPKATGREMYEVNLCLAADVARWLVKRGKVGCRPVTAHFVVWMSCQGGVYSSSRFASPGNIWWPSWCEPTAFVCSECTQSIYNTPLLSLPPSRDSATAGGSMLGANLLRCCSSSRHGTVRSKRQGCLRPVVGPGGL
jgi:hypothetical protein